tara:strand:+ start:357 stop:878 length:522 start_codon:yes stop_codon:yes gene_type:complete
MSTISKDLDPDTFIGLSLPLDHGDQGFFDKTRTTLQQTRSNIKNLLLTIRGERLGNPTFGSDLMRIIFEQDDGSLGDRIEETIRASVSEWLPYVNIKKIETTADERNPNQLNVRLDFTIDVDQQVAQLDLNLRAADEATFGTSTGESFEELKLFLEGDITADQIDTIDPFYSL